MQNENLAFAALQRAFRQPGAAAFEVSGHTIPYRRFADLLMYFAQRMRASGVDRRSTVGLAIKDGATAAIAASAVALLGSKWVPVSADSTAVFRGVTHVFGTPQRTRHPGRIDFDRSWFEAPVATESALKGFPGYDRPEDVWMIAQSSGTTGKPKFMPISYATVWRRMGNPELQDGVPPITCNLFPATSYVGAKINIGNLVLGGTNVARAPWDDLVANGVNRVMGSPAQIAAAIFSQNPAGGRIRSCKVTGAQVTAQFVETALRYFEELLVLYGMTEAGVTTLARFTDATPYDGSAGQPFEGAELEVLDTQQMPCPTGVEGTIRVRTRWAVPGYIGEPELTAAFFRNGWFYPGDLGALDSSGALHISGRVGDVINAGGMKFNAAELDEIIQVHPDVVDGYCFIEKDERGVDVLCAVVALRSGASERGLSSITETATQKLGRSRSPRRIYVTVTVPRNENGKPMRAQAAAAASGFQRVSVEGIG